MNLTKAQFTNAEIMEATGLDAATLQTWANRGIVVPASENPGRDYIRGRRLYSAEDAIWLSIVKKMTDWELPIGLVTLLCSFGTVRDGLRQNNGKLPFIALAWSRIEHGTEGHFITVKVTDLDLFTKQTEGEISSGRVVLVVPTRETETETRRKLDIITGRRDQPPA